MTSHVDGAVLSKPRVPWGTTRLAFGWLERESGYRRGTCPMSVLKGLEEAARHPEDRTRGWHLCPFCPPREYGPTKYLTSQSEVLTLGDASLGVPTGRKQLWVAPTLVLHYISVHEYLPPPAVISALKLDDVP